MDDFIDPRKTIKEVGLTEGMRVADFGAGSGAFSIEAAKIVGPSGRVYAIEIQKDMVPRLRNEFSHAKLTNTEVVWGDIERDRGTKIADGIVDVVLLANVLFLLPDKDSCAKEAKRVLKAGGKIVIIDWTDSFGSMGPVPDMIVRPEEVIARFERFGFIFKQHIISVGAHHYGIVLELTNK